MLPGPGELLHFSEDRTIRRFEPHVPATATVRRPYVWALDALNAPTYWFPRQCPRATAWVLPTTTPADRRRLGPSTRVHAVEYRWLDAIRTARLYAYRLPAAPFRPSGDPAYAYVAAEPVEPLAPPVPAGDLLAAHERAGIELRVVTNLWAFWDQVAGSTLGHSGVRLANARPRSDQQLDHGGEADHDDGPAEHGR